MILGKMVQIISIVVPCTILCGIGFVLTPSWKVDPKLLRVNMIKPIKQAATINSSL